MKPSIYLLTGILLIIIFSIAILPVIWIFLLSHDILGYLGFTIFSVDALFSQETKLKQIAFLILFSVGIILGIFMVKKSRKKQL